MPHPDRDNALPLVLRRRDHDEPSVFLAKNLLREARRQRGVAEGAVPSVCLLDPDGDIVRHLLWAGRASSSNVWACYHTDLYEAEVDGLRLGIIGCAVGASFAVLVAEELFASGCQLLISITSAGQIDERLEPPCVILIDRALRGDGTSHAYLPPSDFVEADLAFIRAAEIGLSNRNISYQRGATWTTDAPFRETATAIAEAGQAGVMAVEMEAAALYAFARATGNPLVCFALVTNLMAQITGDFEKGPTNGAEESLQVAVAAARGVLASPGFGLVGTAGAA